ncbi:MAG: putative rane protein [Labilithrix sp.]|nr:putative rane protein [Labilithrix sp.]
MSSASSRAARPSLRARLALSGPLVPDIARGIRAAIATLLPFYFARELGHQELVWMALGGWLGTLADPGGRRSSRAKTLTAFALSGAVVVALTAFVRPVAGAVAVALALVAFAGSLLRATGAATASIGSLLVVVAAIASGGTAAEPGKSALAFAAGGAWAMVLSSIVWPVWTHLPARIAIAGAFRALADYAQALSEAVADGVPEQDPRWGELARNRQRAVRTAIEDARAMALASRARRSGESILGSNLRTLLGSIETQLPMFVALADELESIPVASRAPAASTALAAIEAAYREAATALATPALGSGSRKPSDDTARPSEAPPSEARAVVLLRRLRASSEASARIAVQPDALPELMPEDGGPVIGRRMVREDLRVLHDALSLRSMYFRHAVRVTLAVLAAQVIGQILSPNHAQWVTVTTVAVLQPYPGVTMTRAIERVIGTVLGSLVAVAITFTIKSPVGLAATMVPLSVAAVATRPRSYRLFTFFLTPVFVLLAERWHGDWWVAAERAGDAFLGGGIALVAALVFPSREEKRLSVALDAVLYAVRHYADAVVTAHEPLRAPTEATDAMLFVTHARRLAGAFTALDAHPVPPGNEALLRAVLAHVLRVLDRSGDASGAPDLDAATTPAVRAALARILRHCELVGTAMPAPVPPSWSRNVGPVDRARS